MTAADPSIASRRGARRDGERAPRTAVRAAAECADSLRWHTRDLHRRAESVGVVGEMIAGTVTRSAYGIYLRNLLPIYEHLERELRLRRADRAWHTLAAPEIYRAQAIAADLTLLGGADWPSRWPVLQTATAYCARVAAAAASSAQLAAHVYTRYLGDLNGGRIIGRLVGRALTLEPETLATHRFEQIADLAAFKEEYRRGLDRVAVGPEARAELLAEAAVAFELNIELAAAVTRAAHDRLP